MNKDNLIVAGLVLALIFSGLAFFGGDIGPQGDRGDRGDRGERGLGGASGPEYYGLQVFYAGHVDGGLTFATTSSGAGVLVANDLVRRDGYVKYMTINAEDAVTVTFPATSTLTHYIPQSGMCTNIVIENSGDSNLTLAGGTGMDLQEPDATGTEVVIGANNFALVTLCRQANTDILLLVEETRPG